MSSTAAIASNARYISVHEALDLFPDGAQPSYATLYRWLKTGCIPCLKIGHRYRVDPREVERFILSSMSDGAPTVD